MCCKLSLRQGQQLLTSLKHTSRHISHTLPFKTEITVFAGWSQTSTASLSQRRAGLQYALYILMQSTDHSTLHLHDQPQALMPSRKVSFHKDRDVAQADCTYCTVREVEFCSKLQFCPSLPQQHKLNDWHKTAYKGHKALRGSEYEEFECVLAFPLEMSAPQRLQPVFHHFPRVWGFSTSLVSL